MFGISRKEHNLVIECLRVATQAIIAVDSRLNYQITQYTSFARQQREERDRIWGRLDDMDRHLRRNYQESNFGDSPLQYYRQRIGVLRNRVKSAMDTISERDKRILSLLEEIRAKNVTIARLQGMVGRVESPDEPGIPCQS
jgi:chromosome segregation ATPase